ncbi:MAG: hypothetical protein J0I99_14545 [Devosia sp.]|uniref:hypothetical protein n=1 Tax=Devosia sp. TaxID=1871048 RepID=UPI001AC2165A|nr:hypothetical protein [Devosia sp.]MBN9316958.1 hypothetical protein [Devosia sp.]
MHRFIDKAGRLVEIDMLGDVAHAYSNGKCIGFVETTGQIELEHGWEPPKVTGWELHPAFRRAGIATEMVRLLYEEHGELQPADKNQGIGDVNALNDDGMAITRHCQKLGYIGPFPDEVDDQDWGN